MNVPPIDEACRTFRSGLGRILVDLHGADGVRLVRVGGGIGDSKLWKRDKDKPSLAQAEQGKASCFAFFFSLSLLTPNRLLRLAVAE